MTIRALFDPGTTLRRRVLHAGGWNFGLRMVLRVSTTARMVVLARLLAPDDFGLMGVAFVALEFLERVTSTGFRPALVQRRGRIDDHLDTAWTVDLIRHLVVAGGLVLGAPLVAALFNEPRAVTVVQVMALGIAISGLTNIGIVFFERELEFHRLFLYQLSGILANIIVGIGAAVALRNVWALVLGFLAQHLVSTIASYFVHPHRPRLRFQRQQAAEMFGFGKWVFGADTLTYLLNNVDYVVVGRMLGSGPLGLYRVAFNFSQLAATELTLVIGKVAFPAYSKLQASAERLSRAYLQSVDVVAALAVPASVGLALVAAPLVEVLLGERWVPMTLSLQMLALVGMTRALASTSGPLFRAVGRPAMVAKLAGARLVVLLPMLLYAAGRWGIDGAAGAVLASSLLVHGFSVGLAFREVGATRRRSLRALGFPALNTGVMALAVAAAERALAPVGGVLWLLAPIAVGAVCYGLAVLASSRLLGYELGESVPGRAGRWLRGAAP